MRKTALAFATALTLVACADPGEQSSFSTDSFNSPTQHGDLSFDEPIRTHFTSSQRFHAFTFSLTGEADVTLDADPQVANLDTVAYLYAADDSGRRVGSYIAKNDDFDGTLASRISESLPAGNYVLIVKAGKTVMTGPFEVGGQCLGAGCPVIEAPGPELYCEGAYESIGKCMDDSLDATEEGCQPSSGSSEAVLCCNLVPGESFCDSVCDGSAPELATNWGSDTDIFWGAVYEDDYTGLEDVTDFAVATCSNPTLDQLGDLIINADDLEHEEEWTVRGWTTPADGSDFTSWLIDENVISAAEQLVGEKVSARFEADVDIPCPNCTDGYVKNGLWFENAGRLLVLDIRAGGDS